MPTTSPWIEGSSPIQCFSLAAHLIIKEEDPDSRRIYELDSTIYHGYRGSYYFRYNAVPIMLRRKSLSMPARIRTIDMY